MIRYSHSLLFTAGLFALSTSLAHAQILSPGVVTSTLGIMSGIGASNAFNHTGGNGNALGVFNGPVGTGISHSQIGNLTNIGQGSLNGLLSSGDHGNRISTIAVQAIGDVGPESVIVNIANGNTRTLNLGNGSPAASTP